MKHLIKIIASDKMIVKAYEHVCFARKKHHSNCDIWALRFNWDMEKVKIQSELLSGTYKFAETTIIRGNDECFELWNSRDSVVLKSIALVLNEELGDIISDKCYHIKGRGGLKAAVDCVNQQLNNYKYMFKSDVRSYYASINHDVLYDLLRKHIIDPKTLSLIYRFMKRTVYCDGYYRDVDKGICRGCSLSPLLGALYLKELDDLFISSKTTVSYCRFMDDWIVLTNNKYQLRRWIGKINKILTGLKLEKAEDKTFVGKIDKGFDFLGFHFSREGLTVSKMTVKKFNDKLTASVHKWRNRFYESGLKTVKKMKGEKTLAESISLYVKNWKKWVNSYGRFLANAVRINLHAAICG